MEMNKQKIEEWSKEEIEVLKKESKSLAKSFYELEKTINDLVMKTKQLLATYKEITKYDKMIKE